MKVLIIIPAYNEELNIEKTVNRIIEYKEKSKNQIDYIIINDGSTDNTKLVCENNNYNIVNLTTNLGIGGAVQQGYKYALDNNYDVAIQFDGDGQHDENYIDKMVDEIEKGSNLVIGSRFIGTKNKYRSTYIRRRGIKIISLLIKLCTRKNITDPTSGFRAVDKKVIELFCRQYPLKYPEPSSTVYIIKSNLKVKEIPVEMYERELGKSSINSLNSIYYMFYVCTAIVRTWISVKN